jgi:uncharacterized membrane protein YcaP (DUF421 family)
MDHSMFHLPLPIAEKVLRAGIVYFFLVLALRVTGKRELAQLSPLDFIVMLSVANAVQNGIIGNENSVTGGLIGAVTLFAMNYTLGYVTFKSIRARHAVLGTPSRLVAEGEIRKEVMKREQITHDDLVVAVERANASGLDDVRNCTLLPSGNFLVELKPERQNQLLEDINSKLDRLLAGASTK